MSLIHERLNEAVSLTVRMLRLNEKPFTFEEMQNMYPWEKDVYIQEFLNQQTEERQRMEN